MDTPPKAAAGYRERLIAARERLGLTRREMAARLLTARQTYEQWERGFRRTPGIAVVAAEALRSPRIREHVAALADGSRTADEIAAALGMSVKEVHNHAWLARRSGADVRLPGRPVGRSGQRAANAQRVLELADGSRTTDQIAAALDLSERTIGSLLAELRQQGHKPKIRKRRNQRGRLWDAFVERVRPLADGTRTIAAIASELGIPYRLAWRAARRLRATGAQIPDVATGRGRRTSPERKALIVADIAAGKSATEIARDHGVSRQMVHYFATREKKRAAAP